MLGVIMPDGLVCGVGLLARGICLCEPLNQGILLSFKCLLMGVCHAGCVSSCVIDVSV